MNELLKQVYLLVNVFIKHSML